MKAYAAPGLDALATAVVFLDRDLAVRYANPAAENLLKISSKNIVGHRLQEVFPDHAPLSAAIQYAAEHNCSYTQHDLTLTTAALDKLEVSCTVTPTDAEHSDGYLLEFNELHQQLRIAREERLHDQTEASRALTREVHRRPPAALPQGVRFRLPQGRAARRARLA
jgi:two-component system nitrogen regulation sensor histidine kinase GlnL